MNAKPLLIDLLINKLYLQLGLIKVANEMMMVIMMIVVKGIVVLKPINQSFFLTQKSRDGHWQLAGIPVRRSPAISASEKFCG